MLRALFVKNFAVIKELEITFQSGLTVISGETGAGKSILVGAVNLILGGRASQEMIRTGTTEASVEAIISYSEPGLLEERLRQLHLEPADELAVRRAVNRTGRNRIYVNDQLVTLQQLQQLIRGLISISGQHEHQLLIDPDTHLTLLDQFGGLEVSKAEVGRLYRQWSEAQAQLGRITDLKRKRAAEAELMRFQLAELTAADLKPGEDRALEQEREVLKNAGTLRESAWEGHQVLYGGRGAVLEQLASVEKILKAIVHIDPSQGAMLGQLEEARIHLEELAHALHRYGQSIDFDPDRLALIDERLSLLQRLNKKYGPTVEHLIRRMEELRDALGQMDDLEFNENQLKQQVSRFRTSYLDSAKALSESRKRAAERLSALIEQALSTLDMPHSRFAVKFREKMEEFENADSFFSPAGIDQLEFLLSANPGEDLKPLARIASGGELSRILLALKSIFTHKGEVETSIFDEVDAGIGGRTAELVGRRLKALAENQQVICITHLPQIACYGDQHFRVSKHASGLETETEIHLLSQEERVEELARMLGGITISPKTRAHALEMLQHVRGSS